MTNCVTFTTPIKKEVIRIDKNEYITKNISYILQFIKSARFAASCLSDLINNPPEISHRIKCKVKLDDKKNVRFAELNISIGTVFWNT